MVRRFSTEHEAREEMEARLNRPVNKAVWDQLVQDGWVRDVTVADEPFRTLVQKYREIESRFGLAPGVVEGQRVEGRSDVETEVLSDLIAAEAARDPEVRAFRTEVLNDVLIAWQDVSNWLERVAEGEGPPGGFLYAVPYAAGTHQIEYQLTGPRVGPYPIPPITIDANNPAGGTLRVLLAFAEYGKAGVSRMIVNPGGKLHRLHRLSESLAEICGWQPAAATTFVLTGVPPAYSRATATFHYIMTESRAIPRLTFTVDPSLPAAEVLALFRQARRELMAPLGGAPRRKPVKERLLRLAEFAAAHQSGTWEERMNRWNELHAGSHPDWRYDDRRRFQRDVARSLERVAKQGVTV